MAQDPVVSLLLKSPLTPAQRRAASEAFTGSANEDELVTKMEGLKLPKQVMADLWDLKVANPSQPISEPKGPEGSALGRFASNLGEQINPVTMVKGVWNTLPIPQAMGGQGIIEGPYNAAAGILGAANEQRLKAHEEMDKGNYGQMAARSVAAAIPILGPAAAAAGEQIGSGDIEGGLGKSVGIVGPMLLAFGALKGKSTAQTAAKAGALEREAVQQVAQKVLAPKDRKYQPMAQDAAKELLKRGVQGDRVAIQQWADDLINDAASRIDEVIDRYPETQTLKTRPVLDMLDDTLKSMEFDTAPPAKNPMQGVVTNAQGQPARLAGKAAPSAPPRGGHGHAAPQNPRVNPVLQAEYDAIKAQRDFIAQRGDDMTFADMRRLRQSLDRVGQTAKARAKAAGDMSLDVMERATSEAGNAVRRQIAAERPELAGPNADMHLGIAVRDILDPVKGRPAAPPSSPHGVTGGYHATAALIGSGLSNVPGLKAIGAYVASEVLPKLREAQVSPANQLRLANDKFKLAQSLKAGKVSTAQSILRNMSMYIPGLTGIGRITEPSGAPQ